MAKMEYDSIRKIISRSDTNNFLHNLLYSSRKPNTEIKEVIIKYSDKVNSDGLPTKAFLTIEFNDV